MVQGVIDGYYSFPLDDESQPLTTFIMELGCFMYLRMPQGYLASGDAYTRRYDEIIKNVPRKIKIVNDNLLFDKNIEDTFYYTLDYLLHCKKNSIVHNREKFQFCQDVVQFRGLQITSLGVIPCDNHRRTTYFVQRVCPATMKASIKAAIHSCKECQQTDPAPI